MSKIIKIWYVLIMFKTMQFKRIRINLGLFNLKSIRSFIFYFQSKFTSNKWSSIIYIELYWGISTLWRIRMDKNLEIILNIKPFTLFDYQSMGFKNWWNYNNFRLIIADWLNNIKRMLGA